MSVNGMGTAGTLYLLDGIWNMNTGWMRQTTIQPNPDNIQEVRVLQNNYSVRCAQDARSRVQKMIRARRPPPADVPGGRMPEMVPAISIEERALLLRKIESPAAIKKKARLFALYALAPNLVTTIAEPFTSCFMLLPGGL
jgi:hypothetical protein